MRLSFPSYPGRAPHNYIAAAHEASRVARRSSSRQREAWGELEAVVSAKLCPIQGEASGAALKESCVAPLRRVRSNPRPRAASSALDRRVRRSTPGDHGRRRASPPSIRALSIGFGSRRVPDFAARRTPPIATLIRALRLRHDQRRVARRTGGRCRVRGRRRRHRLSILQKLSKVCFGEGWSRNGRRAQESVTRRSVYAAAMHPRQIRAFAG